MQRVQTRLDGESWKDLLFLLPYISHNVHYTKFHILKINLSPHASRFSLVADA